MLLSWHFTRPKELGTRMKVYGEQVDIIVQWNKIISTQGADPQRIHLPNNLVYLLQYFGNSGNEKYVKIGLLAPVSGVKNVCPSFWGEKTLIPALLHSSKIQLG